MQELSSCLSSCLFFLLEKHQQLAGDKLSSVNHVTTTLACSLDLKRSMHALSLSQHINLCSISSQLRRERCTLVLNRKPVRLEVG